MLYNNNHVLHYLFPDRCNMRSVVIESAHTIALYQTKLEYFPYSNAFHRAMRSLEYLFILMWRFF